MTSSDDHIRDAALVSRACRGDESAFTELFHSYYERIRRFSFRLALGSQAADDIAQETFIRAARQLPAMRNANAFAPWLYRIAANVANDYTRANLVHQQKLAAAALETSSTPTRESSVEIRLHIALQALPLEQRAAIVLVYMEGCTHAEAAQRLDCAESTISWRIFLAKRVLRKKMIP